MARRLRYSAHALQRLDERGILRHWVDAVVGTRPQVYGRDHIFSLSASELAVRFGGEFSEGIRVVVDSFRRRVVTVHWDARSAA